MKAPFTFRSILLVSLSLLTPRVALGAADRAAAVDALVPRLADADVSSRYAAQMELQDLASQASRPGRSGDRETLGAVLADRARNSGVPQPARVWMVRQLEYMGGAEAVPGLSGLLTNDDAELRECARRALEKNPAPSASAALRTALEQGGDDRWRIGLINALGWRGDAQAVALLRKELDNPATGPTAARALGRIATPDANEALTLGIELNRFPEVAEGLMDSAQRLAAQGDSEAARLVYSNVFKDSSFPPARAAALRGLARVDAGGFKALLGGVLSGTDAKLRHAAIAAVADTPDLYIDDLVRVLPGLAAETKVQLIPLLNAEAEPVLMKAVADEDETLRLTALRTLGAVGTAACVPILLQASTEDNRAVKTEARTALRNLRGNGPVMALKSAAAEEPPAGRAAALEALAVRELPQIQPLFLQAAAADDAGVRRAALAGLGTLGRDEDMAPLAKIALSTSDPEAFDALESMAGRTVEPQPIARALLLMTENNASARLALLDVLGTLGGPEVMDYMRGLLAGPNAEAALAAMGRWPTLDGAVPLLDIASDSNAPAKQHTLALQGAVRLIGSDESAPAAQRADAVLRAWSAARDSNEQKLVLSVMGKVPDPPLVATLKPLLADETIKAEAVLAGVALAQALADVDREVAKDLAQTLRATGLSRDAARRLAPLLRD